MDASARFWAKVNKTDGCWLWEGVTTPNGYGMFPVPGTRKSVSSHRFSWEQANGEIPQGLSVLHRCDVRACVNPEHLFLGTQMDNMIDMMKKRYPDGILLDRTITTREAAALLGLSPSQVTRLANAGRLAGASKLGRDWMFWPPVLELTDPPNG